jgi:hypothetical protein
MTTKIIGQDLLATIKAVHVEYCGRIPNGYAERLQLWVEDWIYQSETIEVEDWRIEAEFTCDPEISGPEAQRRAVVELGHILYLESLDYVDPEYGVATSPIA